MDGFAHLMEQFRGLLWEGSGRAELLRHWVLAVVAVVILTGPANQADCLENWKQKRSLEFPVLFHLNSLTVVAGDVLIDPGEAELGGQHSGETHVNIIGVQGGLVGVLVSNNLNLFHLVFT